VPRPLLDPLSGPAAAAADRTGVPRPPGAPRSTLALYLSTWYSLAATAAATALASAAPAAPLPAAGAGAGAGAGVVRESLEQTLTDMFVDRVSQRLLPPEMKPRRAAPSPLPAPLPATVAPYLAPHFAAPSAHSSNSRSDNSSQSSDAATPMLSADARAALLRFLDLPTLRREAAWVLRRMHALRVPIVFSHNDLHSGNVMVDDDALALPRARTSASGPAAATAAAAAADANVNADDIATASLAASVEVTLDAALCGDTAPFGAHDAVDARTAAAVAASNIIDFEYSGPNYRAFDLSNSIGEATMAYTGPYPGFTLDFPAALALLSVVPRISAAPGEGAATLPLRPSPPPGLRSWRALLAELSPHAFTAFERAFAGHYAHGVSDGVVALATLGFPRPSADAGVRGSAVSDDAIVPELAPNAGAVAGPQPPAPLTAVSLSGLTVSTSSSSSSFSVADPVCARESARRSRARAARTSTSNRLLYEAAWAQLAGHLQWVFWGVTLADGPSPDDGAPDADAAGTAGDGRTSPTATTGEGKFGYLEYACVRAAIYWRRKQALLWAEAQMARSGGWAYDE
jgi:hypothetical protein